MTTADLLKLGPTSLGWRIERLSPGDVIPDSIYHAIKTVSAGTSSVTDGQLIFSNSNGVSFGISNNVITGSIGGGFAAGSVSAGTTSLALGQAIFSNSNGVSFGLDGATITATVFTNYQSTGPYLTTAMQSNAVTISNINVSAGTTSNNLSALTFSNQNGLSFGLNGSVITGSYTVPAVVNSSATISAGTASQTLDNLVFSNSNGISFGLSNSTITASYTVPVVTNSSASISAGTQSTILGSLVFSNSNNFTFGLSNNTITASYTVPSTAGLISNINLSAGTTSNNLSAVTFSNLNNVSFGLNGSVITASIPAAGAPGSISAGTESASLGQVIFSDSNGISFGMDAGTVTASYTVPTVTNSSWTVSAGTTSNTISQLVFSNSNNFSFGLNAGTITGSYTVPVVTNSSGTISAGTSSQTFNNLVFSNSNGISFGLSDSTITASYTVPSTAGLLSNIKVSAGTTANNLSAITFSDSNGVSFGIDASTITASIATSLTNINVSAGTTSNNLSAITFSNSNGLSFGLNGSTITGAYSVPLVTNSSWTVSDANTSGTVARLAFTQSNGLTLSLQTGLGGLHTVVGSYTVPLTAGLISNINVSAGTTSNNLKSVTFADSNGISFGLDASTITASYTVPSTAGLISAINVSAGTTSNNLSAITFSNSNGLAFGLNGSTITGSYTVPTVTNSSFSVQDSATTINPVARIAFSTGNNITLSLSTGASSATVGVQHNLAGTSTGFGGNLISASMTHNSSGLNLSLDHPAWLTTADLSQNSSKYIQAWELTGNTAGTTSSLQGTKIYFEGGNSITVSGTSNTIKFSVGNYLTTAMASDAATISNIKVSAGTSSANLSALTFSNSNKFSFGLDGSTITGSFDPINIGMSTGGNTAGTTGTFDGAGLQYILAGGTNITLSQSSNASSVTLSINGLSFANSNNLTFGTNAGTLTASAPVSFSAGTTNNNLTNVVFSNSNLMSFGLNGSTITGNKAINFSAGTTDSSITSQVIFSNANNVSFGMTSNTITASADPHVTLSDWFPYSQIPAQTNNSTVFGNSSIYFVPFDLPAPMYADRIVFFMSVASTSSNASTITAQFSQQMGIYSRGAGTNSTRIDLIRSSEGYFSVSLAATSCSIVIPDGRNSDTITYFTKNAADGGSTITTMVRDLLAGPRALQIPIMSTFTAGHYWLGYGIKTTHGTGSASWNIKASYHLQTLTAVGYMPFGSTQTSLASNNATARNAWAGMGSFSAQTAALPATVALNGTDIKMGPTMTIPFFCFSGFTTNSSNI